MGEHDNTTLLLACLFEMDIQESLLSYFRLGILLCLVNRVAKQLLRLKGRQVWDDVRVCCLIIEEKIEPFTVTHAFIH